VEVGGSCGVRGVWVWGYLRGMGEVGVFTSKIRGGGGGGGVTEISYL